MSNRGFTAIELSIIIAIMAVLLVLAYAGLRSTQPDARDNARSQNAGAIARGLEEYYQDGNSNLSIQPGEYPSLDELAHARGMNVPAVGTQVSGGYVSTWLDGAPAKDLGLLRPISDYTAAVDSLTSVQSSSLPVGNYAYEPLRYVTSPSAGWALCQNVSDACVRFNLYYRNEVGNTVQVIRSAHQ